MNPIKALIYYLISLSVLSIVCRLIVLATLEYPRKVTWSKGEDAASVIYSILAIAFYVWLLFGGAR